MVKAGMLPLNYSAPWLRAYPAIGQEAPFEHVFLHPSVKEINTCVVLTAGSMVRDGTSWNHEISVSQPYHLFPALPLRQELFTLSINISSSQASFYLS